MSMKKSNDTIGNVTPDLLACSAVPQPTARTACPNEFGSYIEINMYKVAVISLMQCKKI